MRRITVVVENQIQIWRKMINPAHKNHSVIECFCFAVWRPRDTGHEGDVCPKYTSCKEPVLISKTENKPERGRKYSTLTTQFEAKEERILQTVT